MISSRVKIPEYSIGTKPSVFLATIFNVFISLIKSILKIFLLTSIFIDLEVFSIFGVGLFISTAEGGVSICEDSFLTILINKNINL